MKAKKNKFLPLIVLAAVVVVLIVALAVLSNLEDEPEQTVALFSAEFSADDITAVAWQDEETDVVLDRTAADSEDEEDSWTLRSDPNLPIDSSTASTASDEIFNLTALRKLPSDSETEDMGLDTPTMVLTIAIDGADPTATAEQAETATGETATGESALPEGVYTLTVGAENEITQAYYARASWNGALYTINSSDLSSICRTPQQLYAEQEITDIELEEVATMTLSTPTETLEFSYDGETWTLTDDPAYTLDQDLVEKMAATICDMQTAWTITDPEEDSVYGLDAPDATVTLVANDGSSITCWFGMVDPEDDSLCYLRSSAAEGVVYEVDSDHSSAYAYTKETLKGEESTAETAETSTEDVAAEH